MHQRKLSEVLVCPVAEQHFSNWVDLHLLQRGGKFAVNFRKVSGKIGVRVGCMYVNTKVHLRLNSLDKTFADIIYVKTMK